MENIRLATLQDLPELLKLEKDSFTKDKAAARRSLRLSISSRHQEVYILESDSMIGSIVIQFYKYTARLYSIAVADEYRGQGYGKRLLKYCENVARSRGISTVSLEVDANDLSLTGWYERQGYTVRKKLDDYYGKNKHAFRMLKTIDTVKKKSGRLQNIIVSDDPSIAVYDNDYVEIISSEEYIYNVRFQKTSNFRIFNMSDSYRYQSKGYYVSLLASARDHRVIPSVATMQDVTSVPLMNCFADEYNTILNDELRQLEKDTVEYTLVLGHELNGQSTKLSRHLYKLFEAPFVTFRFRKGDKWLLEKVELLSIKDLPMIPEQTVRKIAKSFFAQKKFNRSKLKNYEYDLAILVNPDEENPPSNKKALDRFKKMGEKNGFFVEFITKDSMNRINEFDALLIRETTAVNDHTYQISRFAYAEGLVVVDDPWSILKCCNKFYLMERMMRAKILMPKSMVIARGEESTKKLTKVMDFPIVLKQPDSAFSLGVHKVKNMEELELKCAELLKSSEFVIAQEYLPSEYDWRIGVMNNEVLYACRYYMATGHWQIYNWSKELTENSEFSGNSETLDIGDVPAIVIETALKAASYIGDGLYGVDLKLIDGVCYLIEINDNPSIDSGIEDAVLGDVLYDRIIRIMKDRITQARNINKYIEL
ncbi:GNAT family N-acetyltransferase [Clostridia bacterium]|nr:GNAT family N-acetyltransferase [Clostridia bacterium]